MKRIIHVSPFLSFFLIFLFIHKSFHTWCSVLILKGSVPIIFGSAVMDISADCVPISWRKILMPSSLRAHVNLIFVSDGHLLI